MNPLDNYILESILARKKTVKDAAGDAVLSLLKKYSYDNLSPSHQRRTLWKDYPDAVEYDEGRINIKPSSTGYTIFYLYKVPAEDISKFKFGEVSSTVGTLHIVDCDIKDFTQLFDKNSVLNCNVHIYDCKNLSSLKGLPKRINGELYISNCPKLMKYDGPSWITDLIWIQNGASLHTSDLKKRIQKSCPAHDSLFHGLSQMLGYSLYGNDIIRD